MFTKIPKTPLIISLSVLIAACNSNSQQDSHQDGEQPTAATGQAADTSISADKKSPDALNTKDSEPADTAATPTQIDWSTLDTDTNQADLSSYSYPFAIDSQPVTAYADYFDLSPATAQHNLTVSMASNEALSKVLDLLSTTYLTHRLTDDEHMTMLVYTTPDIAATSYEYTFAKDFAKGLPLLIVVNPLISMGSSELSTLLSQDDATIRSTLPKLTIGDTASTQNPHNTQQLTITLTDSTAPHQTTTNPIQLAPAQDKLTQVMGFPVRIQAASTKPAHTTSP